MIETITLQNKELGTSLVLSMHRVLSENYILTSCSWSQVGADFATTHYLGQSGETLVSTTLKTRSITIKGTIANWGGDPDKMTSYKNTLNRFVNPLQELNLYYDKGGTTYGLDFTPDKSITWGTKESTNNEVVCEFQITGEAFSSTFYEVNPTISLPATALDYTLFFPFRFIDSRKVQLGLIDGEDDFALVDNVILTYDGQVPTGIILYITCIIEEENGLQIANVSHDNETITIKGHIMAGDELVINTILGSRSVTLNGENAMYMFQSTSQWMQIYYGDNEIHIASLSDTEEDEIRFGLQVEYNVQHLEVEGAE